MNDVTVEGNGSMFMFHGKMTTFATIDSTNITIQNLSFDFRTPTVVDVTVESTDGNTAVMYVPECYDYAVNGTTVTWMSDVSPYTGKRYWTTTNGMNYKQVFDIKTGTTSRGGSALFDGVTQIDEIGNHRLKFTYSSRPSDIVAGKCYQMRPTVRDHAGMFFWKSNGVTLQDINAHFLHGFGIVGQNSGKITLDGVILETPEGSGRTTAGYADFIQMSGCKDQITIKDCVFSNPHDDPINVHGTFNLVKETNVGGDKKKVTVRYEHGETAGFPNFFVGDEIRFLKKSNATTVKDGETEWKATVTAIDGPDGKGGRHSGYDNDVNEGLRRTTLTLDKDVPEDVASDTYVIENLTYRPKVLIEGCVFKETPTRGILMKAGGGEAIIRNNTFDNMGMNSIQIEAMMGWYESGPVENVTIEGNTFISSNNPVILVDPDGAGSTQTPVHKNITIKNNTFYMKNGNAVNIKNTKGVTVSGNKIYRANPNVTVELTPPKTTYKISEEASWTGAGAAHSANALNDSLYSFNGCTDVAISGNTYGGGLRPQANISGGMTNDDVTITKDVAGTSNVNVLPTTGEIGYESDNEEVLSITSQGHLTAVSAGTANVRAYTMVGSRKFVSDWKEITVSGEAAQGQAFVIKNNAGTENAILRATTEYEKKIQYTLESKNGTDTAADETTKWSVVDARTLKATDCATIDQDGLLTTKKDGVVRIVAKRGEGSEASEAREILVINKGQKELNEQALVIYGTGENSYGEDKDENGNRQNWELTSSGDIKITGSGDSAGIFNNQTVKNMFVTTQEYANTGLEVSVKLTGVLGSQWREAGLWIGKDADNYVGISRKYRSEGDPQKKISMVREIGGANKGESWQGLTLTETEGKETVWLKLSVSAEGKVTGSYSLDGNEWTPYDPTAASTGDTNKVTGEESYTTASGYSAVADESGKVKIGFYAARSGSNWTFSDLTIKQGEATESTINMSHENHAPSVARKSEADDVSCVKYESGVVTLDKTKLNFADEDGDLAEEPNDCIVKWMVSDDDQGAEGTYYVDPSVAYAGEEFRAPARFAGKYVKALVIPQDIHGLCGVPFLSKKVQIGDDAGTLPESVTVKAADDTRSVSALDTTVQYSATIKPAAAPTKVTWSVKDAVSGNDTQCAEINETTGLLTAKKNGIVEVIATTTSGLKGREILVINSPKLVLSNDMKIDPAANPMGDNQWSIPEDGKISIKTKSGNGLWNTQTADIFCHQVANMENGTVTVKMENKTQNGYQEAGLVLFSNQNNYVFVGRKHAGGGADKGIKLVYQNNDNNVAPNESQKVNDSNSNSIYLKLEKTGNTIKGFYSDNGTDWTEVGTSPNTVQLGNDLKAGFYAANGDSSTEFLFSELKVKNGNGNEETIPLTFTNSAPSVSDVQCTYDETTQAVEASYTFADTDTGDTEGQSIVRYMAASEENGTYALVTEESELAGKYVKALVIPQDSHGMYGTPVLSSNAVQAGEMAAGVVPKSAESALKTASVTGAGDFGTFDPANKYYVTTATKDQDKVSASFALKDTDATLEVSLNGKALAADALNAISLVSGINVIRATVTAEDGATKSEYRFVILRKGDPDADASKILLNNTILFGFDADKTEYEYRMLKDSVRLQVEAAAQSEKANVKVVVNGAIIENGTVANIVPGRNDVAVYITPETKFPQKKYQITVYVPDDTNANLKTVSFDSGVVLEKGFDPVITSYEGIAMVPKATLSVTAEEPTATLELTEGETSLATSENGSLTKEISFTAGSAKTLKVEVTSPDKSGTETYTLNLDAVDKVMLSDLNWDASSSVGWGEIHRNESTGEKKISLRGEDDGIVSYDSGIGGHATMNLIYNIDPKKTSYKWFETWLGIDLETNAEGNATTTSAASVKYSIYTNDGAEPVWTSGEQEMGINTPAKHVLLDMTGVTKLRIYADDCGSNGNDHVSLGDAKFLTALNNTEPPACACAIGEINVKNSLGLLTGKSATLTPDATIIYNGCSQHSDVNTGRVSYKYEVIEGGDFVSISQTEGASTTVTAQAAGTAKIRITAMLDNDSNKTKPAEVSVRVAETAEQISSLNAEYAFGVKNYEPSKAYDNRSILVVRNQKNDDESFGSVGEGMLASSSQDADDSAISFLQFDLSEMATADIENMETAKLKLTLAGGNHASEGNALKAAVVPAESGLTDLKGKNTWSKISGAVTGWLSESGNRFTEAGTSGSYNTGSGKTMDQPTLDNPPVTLELDITAAVKAALKGDSEKLILALNETKGSQHYFVRSTKSGVANPIAGATADMEPVIVFTYEGGSSEPECSCEIESFSVEGGTIRIGATAAQGTFQLSPTTKIKGGCQMTGHPNGNTVTYRYEIKQGATNTAKATVDSASGLVTATQTGDVVVTVTATLASGKNKTTDTKDVTIKVTKLDSENPSKEEAEQAVKDAISAAKEIYDFCAAGNEDNYTADTWNAFKEAYESAQTPDGDLTPEQLVELADALKAAQEALAPDETKAAENAANAISKADAEYGETNTEKYDTALWDAYITARNNLEGAQSAEDKILCQIKLAEAEAKLYDNAKAIVTDAVATAGGYKKGDYTPTTWSNFETAYNKAKNPPANATAKELCGLSTLF